MKKVIVILAVAAATWRCILCNGGGVVGLDLRINMTVENNVEKSRKSFNQANQGSDNVAD